MKQRRKNVGMQKHIYKHVGVVKAIFDDKVEVEVKRSSACDQCHAKSACMSEETIQKMIVPFSTQDRQKHVLHVGDFVVVMIEAQMAHRAVVLAYIFPLIIFIGMFFLFLWVLHDERWSAMLAICLMSPYFLALWMMRDRLKNTFKIYLKYD